MSEFTPLPRSRRPAHVVIHEHSDALRTVVRQTLLAEGFDADLSLDRAALVGPALRQAQPDVLLLDLDAPDADGLALCRGLREAHPHMGLLAMSTRSGAEWTACCLEAGADQLLCKPISPIELSAHIRRLLERARSWSQAGPRPGRGTNPF